MPDNFLVDVGASIGAGQDRRQRESLNALAVDAGRENLRQQTKVFSEQEQRLNTQFVADATGFVLNNPQALPGALSEMQRRGIMDPNIQPQDITFDQVFEMNQNALGALGGTPPTEFGAQTSGLDPEGKPAFGRLNESTGQFDIAGGLTPSAGGAFGGDPSAVRLFNTLSEAAAEVGLDGKPTRRAIQAQTQLGTRARAGTTSSRERIATDEDLTESVAESEATIAQRKKFAELTGSSRAKKIDKNVEAIQSLDVNVRNLDKAIAAIDAGASTGAIESRFFPTIRKSTVLLEQIQSELGLDVVGGVTFGALSKGELDLALTVALPVKLQPPELRQWLQAKKTAQEKLRAYYAEQIDFLDQGGSVAGFLRSKQRGSEDVLQQARDAIEAGADAEAVRQRLEEMGIDTSNL